MKTGVLKHASVKARLRLAGFQIAIREQEGSKYTERIVIVGTPFEVQVGLRDVFIVEVLSGSREQTAYFFAVDERDLVKELKVRISAHNTKRDLEWTDADRRFLRAMKVDPTR
jgi:hypothetical protein